MRETTTDWLLYDKFNNTYAFAKKWASERPVFAPGGRLFRVTFVDGTRLDLVYDKRVLCTQNGTSGSNCPEQENVVRLLAVDSNLGYQIKYEYETTHSDFAYDDLRHARLKKVMAINKTVEACRPHIDTCTNLSQAWPSVTFDRSTSGSDTVVTVTNALSQSVVYTYDSSRRLRGVRLPSRSSGFDTSYVYGSDGRVSHVYGDPGSWQYTYADGSTIRTTTITDPDGKAWTVKSRLSDGQVTEERNPLGHRTAYVYNEDGLLQRVTAPENNYVQYDYDDRGNVTSVARYDKAGANPIVTSLSYPACGGSNRRICNKPSWTQDWRGRTDYTYDNTHGGVLTVTAPDGGQGRLVTTTGYERKTASYKDFQGNTKTALVYRQTSQTVSGGARTDIAYQTGSASNLLVTSISASGSDVATAATSFGYDLFGNLIWQDGPVSGTGDRINMSYDALRRPTVTIGPKPTGSGLQYTAAKTWYDSDGRVWATQTGRASGPTSFSSFVPLETQYNIYDSRSRVSRQWVAGSSAFAAIDYRYDQAGRLECSALRMNALTTTGRHACVAYDGVDGKDRVSRREYDAAGRLTKQWTGYGGAGVSLEEFGYHPNGTIRWVQDGNGNRTTYEYDAHDRQTKVRYPTTSVGAKASSTSDYDAYQYAPNSGLLQRQTKRRGDSDDVVYGYDPLGRLKSIDAPGTSGDLSMTYDIRGNLKTASANGRTLTYTYDAFGQLKSEAGPLGTTGFHYDAAGRMTRIDYPGSGGFYVNYDYDAAGQVTRIREKGATTGVGVLARYEYDQLGRRDKLIRGNGVVTDYGFDQASRLTDLDVIVPSSTNYNLHADFQYNAAGQITREELSSAGYAALEQTDHQSFQVDGLNRYTSLNGNTLTYDQRMNLTSDSLGESYGYDELDRLTSVTNGGGETSLSYDPAGRLYQMRRHGWNLRFAYAGEALIQEVSGSGSIYGRYVHGAGVDEPLVYYRGSGTGDRRFLSADERGSIVLVTRSDGSVMRRYRYDDDGNRDTESEDGGLFGYTGQLRIKGTSLWHYKARAYSPRLGRFLQTDPIGYGDGLNMYAYV
ncbi:RHS repeat domain-containing protein, partial [Parvularcula maris]